MTRFVLVAISMLIVCCATCMADFVHYGQYDFNDHNRKRCYNSYGPAALAIVPASRIFGNTTQGNYSTASLVVSNIGESAATGLTLSTLPAPFSTDWTRCGTSLAAFSNCSTQVRFAPTQAGYTSATLTASYTGGSAAAALGGTGVANSSVLTFDFEETGVPTGWAVNAGSPNFDYTTIALEGLQSLYTASNTNSARLTFTPADTVYFSVGFYQVADVASDYPIKLYTSDGVTLLGQVLFRQTGLTVGATATGGTAQIGTQARTIGAKWYLKGKFVNGTNTSLTIWLSSDGTTWTQSASCTNGTTIGQLGRLIFSGMGTSTPSAVIWDRVKKSTTDITDGR